MIRIRQTWIINEWLSSNRRHPAGKADWSRWCQHKSTLWAQHRHHASRRPWALQGRPLDVWNRISCYPEAPIPAITSTRKYVWWHCLCEKIRNITNSLVVYYVCVLSGSDDYTQNCKMRHRLINTCHCTSSYINIWVPISVCKNGKQLEHVILYRKYFKRYSEFC